MKFTERTILSSRRIKVLTVVAAFLFGINTIATAQTETVLYNFSGGADGAAPVTGPVLDAAGNLYGTTYFGGHNHADCESGCGTVFELSPAGTKTILHNFNGAPNDGANPYGALVRDLKGNLYGTTVAGGASNDGTVFKVNTTGVVKVLYNFAGGADGAAPYAGLLFAAGTLYGTTTSGGTGGGGTVFELSPDGTFTVLHSFAYGDDPSGDLIRDADGNLYGTTAGGGILGCGGGGFGCGVVFEVTPAGTESVLYSFTGGADGREPSAGLVRGKQGDLFGVTSFGGRTDGSCVEDGCGVVFHLAPDGTETSLFRFTGGARGTYPQAGLVRDSKGNFYGTTLQGGNITAVCIGGCGTVFELAPGGKMTILHAFNGQDGGYPVTSLVLDAQGNLYGVTEEGGTSNHGTVFEITP